MSQYSKFWWWLAVAAWLSVIYFFSNQPNLKSPLAPDLDFVARKIAHLSEYFTLAFILFNAYRSSRMTVMESLLVVIFGALMVAGFDEWHQGFVAGRYASIIDVGIDTLGALGFIILKKRELPS